jgi:hypothetical protein
MARIIYVEKKSFVITERKFFRTATRVPTGADRAHWASPEKILEPKHALRMLFFRQEKSFQGHRVRWG